MMQLDFERAAQLVSSIFSAPIVAAPTFFALSILANAERFLEALSITVMFGTVVPLLVLFGLRKAGLIPDLYASERGTRLIPFLGALCSYALGTVLLFMTSAPQVVTAVMLCYLGNSTVIMLITLRWKISIHTSGITGPATALMYVAGLAAVPVMLLAIPVAWARVRLRAHSPAQVVAGGLLTIVTTWLQLNMYLRIL